MKTPIKIGGHTFIKEADAILYVIFNKDGKTDSATPYEIGLGDSKDRVKNYIHFNIEEKIHREFGGGWKNKKIDRWSTGSAKGLIFLNEKGELILFLDKEFYDTSSIKREINKAGKMKELKKLQEMKDRYQIKEILVSGDDKEGKKLSERMAKIVWDTQTSAFAQKQGMTNAELLRFRLTGELPDRIKEK